MSRLYCIGCNKSKNESEFYEKYDSRTGETTFQSRCKPCHNRNRNRFARNTETTAKMQQEADKALAEARKKFGVL